MKFKYILLISILLTVFTTGCVEKSHAHIEQSGRFTKLYEEETDYGHLYIYHDNINNLTIYMWTDGRSYGYSGMSLIPDWQLQPSVNYTKV